MKNICIEFDNYIRDYQECNPSWIVTLDSGLTVYQDDNRPRMYPESAWERLYEHCVLGDHIKTMTIQFRTNKHSLPSNMDGYFFCKGARGGLGMSKTLQFFIVGTLNNNILETTHWKVPEMIKEQTEQRLIDGAGLCLIRKNMSQFLEHPTS